MRTVVLFGFLLFAGCSSVTTLSPLPADVDTPELETFAGTWQFENEVVHVALREEGVACVASLAWDDSAFVTKQGELTVTHGEHRSFFCLAAFDAEIPSDEFLFFQYRFLSPDELIVWQPRIESFQNAVDNGQLGAADGSTNGHLVLDVESAALLAFIDDPARSDLFEYEDPMVLRRSLR
ncbi:MAG: hypothetical protein MUE60_11485 [Candidatus Eisenbacteria bacterium]|nr:hypothetical protein [Candidatus Eisenbacteria bacterium]